MTEIELIHHYAHFFKTFGNHTTDESQAMIRDSIRAIKAKLGYEPSPSVNQGQRILEVQNDDEEVKEHLKLVRANGVTDEDVLRWWNKTELERALIWHLDQILKHATIQEQKDKGISTSQIGVNIRKAFPIYGRPIDDEFSRGDDKPLPIELYCRIEQLVTRNTNDSGVSYAREVFQSTTYNSYIRKLLRSGRL